MLENGKGRYMETTLMKYVAGGHNVKLLKLTKSPADEFSLFVVIRDRRQVIKPVASYRNALWHFCQYFDIDVLRVKHLETIC